MLKMLFFVSTRASLLNIAAKWECNKISKNAKTNTNRTNQCNAEVKTCCKFLLSVSNLIPSLFNWVYSISKFGAGRFNEERTFAWNKSLSPVSANCIANVLTASVLSRLLGVFFHIALICDELHKRQVRI